MPASDAAAARFEAWGRALASKRLPDFVEARLGAARAGRTPWMATMSPAELLAARSRGIRPIATVSGTCWYGFGRSWTEGHAEGWHLALERLRREAAAAGANAVLDVALRTIGRRGEDSMDFTVIGTAVRVDGLAPSREPILATVTTMEFVRLIDAGIVPTGIAIGANYDWLAPNRAVVNSGGYNTWTNTHWRELSRFWEGVRDEAIANLRADARKLGNGVLAHTHFGQVIRREFEDKRAPIQYLGRWIVIGTIVDTPAKASIPHDIAAVLDMRDDGSPLNIRGRRGHQAYALDTEQEGAI